MTPTSLDDWRAFEAAAWQRAQRDRGLAIRQGETQIVIAPDMKHRDRIVELIAKIAGYAPSRYKTRDGVIHNEFRPKRV